MVQASLSRFPRHCSCWYMASLFQSNWNFRVQTRFLLCTSRRIDRQHIRLPRPPSINRICVKQHITIVSDFPLRFHQEWRRYPLDAIKEASTGNYGVSLNHVKQGYCRICKKMTTSVCSACEADSTRHSATSADLDATRRPALQNTYEPSTLSIERAV